MGKTKEYSSDGQKKIVELYKIESVSVKDVRISRCKLAIVRKKSEL